MYWKLCLVIANYEPVNLGINDVKVELSVTLRVNICKKTYQFKTQCKDDVKISVH